MNIVLRLINSHKHKFDRFWAVISSNSFRDHLLYHLYRVSVVTVVPLTRCQSINLVDWLRFYNTIKRRPEDMQRLPAYVIQRSTFPPTSLRNRQTAIWLAVDKSHYSSRVDCIMARTPANSQYSCEVLGYVILLWSREKRTKQNECRTSWIVGCPVCAWIWPLVIIVRIRRTFWGPVCIPWIRKSVRNWLWISSSWSWSLHGGAHVCLLPHLQKFQHPPSGESLCKKFREIPR